MTTVGSYTATGIPGVPLYRFFRVEDIDLNAMPDGFYLNGDSGANAVVLGGAATRGSLLPGNLVYVDTASSNVSNPNVKRPVNTATTASTHITDATTAPTLLDSGAAGTFANAAYTFVYVWKNASGQITKQSASAAVTPTASHGVSVALPTLPAGASADIYCSEGAGGAGSELVFLANQVVAAATIYTAPPVNTAQPLPPNVNTTPTTTSNVITDLSGVNLGLVFGDPYLVYGPTDNSNAQTEAVTVLKHVFTALLDANSFETSGAPTGLGQKIYPSSNGVSGDLGKLSKVPVYASAGGQELVLGQVIGFEPFTNYGTPGPQVTATYSSPSSAAASTVGGVNLVRVAFSLPSVGRV